MTDTHSKEQRSRNMSRIRSRDTQPEIMVRSLLHRSGFRFRNNVKNLPGKPDIVLPKYKSVIFVHGCFWHRHRGCKRCTTPTSNMDYWKPKLAANARRDAIYMKELTDLGWKTLIVWECETKDSFQLQKTLVQFLKRK